MLTGDDCSDGRSGWKLVTLVEALSNSQLVAENWWKQPKHFKQPKSDQVTINRNNVNRKVNKKRKLRWK